MIQRMVLEATAFFYFPHTTNFLCSAPDTPVLYSAKLKNSPHPDF